MTTWPLGHLVAIWVAPYSIIQAATACPVC